MEKRKLTLSELEVKSFTTELKDVKGGDVVLRTRPMCNMISIFFVCGIYVPTNDWAAECGG